MINNRLERLYIFIKLCCIGILGIFNLFITYGFIQLSYEIKQLFTSKIFLIYIILEYIYICNAYLILKNINNINNTYLKYVNNINNIFYIINISIGIYFTTIIFNNCDIYNNYKYTCIIIKIISIKSLLIISILLLCIISFIKVKYCNRLDNHNNYLLQYNYTNYLPISIKINNVSNITCIICLEEQKINDEWIYLSCNHKYHKLCILHWINLKHTCPICRIIIR